MRMHTLSIRSILWLTISSLTLVITLLVGQEIIGQWQQLQKIKSLKDATLFSDKLFDAIDNLSIERDIAFTMLHAQGSDDIADLQTRLENTRQDTDAALNVALGSISQYRFSELDTLHKTVEKHLTEIRDLRLQINQTITIPEEKQKKALADHWYEEVTNLITETQNLWISFIRHFTDINPVVTQHLRYKHFLLMIDDYTARERALIGKLLVENIDPTHEEVAQLLRWQGIIEMGWKMSHLLADQSGLYTSVGPAFKDAQSHYQTMHDMMHDIFYNPGNQHGTSYPIGIDLWFELSTQAADSLNTLKAASREAKHAFLNQLLDEGKQAIGMHLAILIFALSLCAYCFFVINRRVIKPINLMIEALLNAIQGKPIPYLPVEANTQDEIGKLASVLHAFQQNVEEIKHTSIMLQSYTNALERSNKELDDFAYIASHDLKEPLRGIHNHSRFLLEDNQDKLEPESVDKLNRLVYLSQRMERLVNDLLYFSRLGRQELAIQATDINAVIHDIESTLDVFLHERNAHIVIPKPLPAITCDKPRVTEMFRNLITNAVKYNDKQEKIVEIGFLDTYPSPEGAPLTRVFYVRDNGKGIAREFYDEIFRIFKRLQNNKGNAEEGTGVGLTFVKKIIERHGGKIWLESEPTAGTTFYFTLEEQAYDSEYDGKSAA